MNTVLILMKLYTRYRTQLKMCMLTISPNSVLTLIVSNSFRAISKGILLFGEVFGANHDENINRPITATGKPAWLQNRSHLDA